MVGVYVLCREITLSGMFILSQLSLVLPSGEWSNGFAVKSTGKALALA